MRLLMREDQEVLATCPVIDVFFKYEASLCELADDDVRINPMPTLARRSVTPRQPPGPPPVRSEVDDRETPA